MPYANSLDLDETSSNSASHPDPSCLTLRQYFHPTLNDTEALWKINQTRKTDNNLFVGLRVKQEGPLAGAVGLSCTITGDGQVGNEVFSC